MTEKTIAELQAEIDRLKAHSEDLLAERKAEKKRREEAESTLQTLTGERDGLLSRLDSLTLTGPVLRALESVTVAPPIHGRKLLEDAGIKFVIGKDGIATALDGEGEIPLLDLYQHLNKKCNTPEGMAAFGWILRSSGASGTGSKPSTTTTFQHPASQPKNDDGVVKGLGLR